MKTITSDSYKAHKTLANNNKALDESVKNIFSLPQVVDIERQILNLYRNMTHSRGDHRPGDGQKVKCGGANFFYGVLVCDMQTDILFRRLEQLGHLYLCQPIGGKGMTCPSAGERWQ